MKIFACIVMYLAAIVAANLGVAQWGKIALLATGFLLIPFDLVTRDVLHHEWSRRGGVLWRMALLIAAGSAISFAINASAIRVAIASCAAFGMAAAIDSLVYHICHSRSRLFRSNASNLFSAAADSIIFPAILFGSLPIGLVAGQWMLKMGGSIIWALIFFRNGKPFMCAAGFCRYRRLHHPQLGDGLGCERCGEEFFYNWPRTNNVHNQ